MAGEGDMGGLKDQFFGDRPYRPYPPLGAGFKEPTTSREAAATAARSASGLRALAFAAIEESVGGLTADEVAGKLNMTVLAIRPRVSELRELGKIERTGVRRKNASGMSASVWRARR